MRRIACLPLALFFGLVLFLATAADERKEIERRLKATYEGEIVRLEPLPEQGNFRLEMPKEEAQAVTEGMRIVLLIEKVKLKKKELELRAERIYFYQDIKGTVRGIKDRARKYRLRWKDSQMDEARLQEALNQAFPYLKEKPEEWTGYWPPQKPESPPGQPLARQPSKEIAPGVFTIGIDMTPPTCEFCPDPGYPEAARMQRVEGVGELDVVVTKTGRVGGIRLVKSTGNILLDQAAVIGVSRWRFRPAIRNGKPVGFLMRAEINFHLY